MEKIMARQNQSMHILTLNKLLIENSKYYSYGIGNLGLGKLNIGEGNCL